MIFDISKWMADNLRLLSADPREEIQNNKSCLYNNKFRLKSRVGERIWDNLTMMNRV
jgi:hypothetical protein